MSTKLSCAIHAVADGQSWQLIPLYKELNQRGWDVDFIIDTERLSTSYPLIHEGIDWKLTAALNLDKPEKLYDVIVEYNPVIAPYLLKKTGISLGTVCGGTGNWLAISKSLYLIYAHNLWIGHNIFELRNRRKEGFDKTFPCIGMPSLSHFKGYKPQAHKLTGVYFNGPPFSQEHKRALNATVLEFARQNPDIAVIIKERFLETDEGVHHELTQFDSGGCPNVSIVDATTSVKELIQNASFLFGIATTGFIEALYLQKPVFVLEDHDNEVYLGVPGRQIYEHFVPGMTILPSNAFIHDFHDRLANANTLQPALYKELFPFPDPCAVIADILEMIFAASGGREISTVNFTLDFEDHASFRKELAKLFSRFDSQREEMAAEREILRLKFLILHNALMRIRYVFPHIPHAVYQDYLEAINARIRGARLLEEVIALFEDSGNFFYRFMSEHEEYKEEYLPDPSTLFEKGSENYIKEAQFYFNLHGSTALAKRLDSIYKTAEIAK